MSCLIVFSLNAQTIEQECFFPLAVGNKYQFHNGSDYWFGEIISDTVYQNGKLYFSLPYDIFNFGDTRIDSGSNVYSISKPFFIGGNPEEYHLFKSDASWGDVWPVAWNYNVVIDTGYARCIEDDTLFIFGAFRRVKGVLIFDSSYQYYFFWLASGIGLIRERYDDGTTNELNYARISGIEYGSLVSINESISQQQDNFELHQNYPNPFNPTTTISFNIPETDFVQLKVFDMLGEEVAMLINETKSPGNYSVHFNAADLPSGIYIYSLRVNGQVQNRKMLMIK